MLSKPKGEKEMDLRRAWKKPKEGMNKIEKLGEETGLEAEVNERGDLDEEVEAYRVSGNTEEELDGSQDDFSAIIDMARDYMDQDAKAKDDLSNMTLAYQRHIQSLRKHGVYILCTSPLSIVASIATT